MRMRCRSRKLASAGSLPRSQRGLSFITLLLLLAGIGLLGLGGFRLVPVYINDYKIIGALKSVQEQFQGGSTSPAELRSALYKRFDIEMISGLRAREVGIERDKGEYVLTAQYENEVPYIANIYLKVKFDHRVGIPFR